MSGSMAPGPAAPGTGPSLALRFWLVIAIGLIRTQSSPYGMPGTPGRGNGPARCPRCNQPAGKTGGGQYICVNGHVFEAKKGSPRKGKNRKRR
jgi:hypothetical protein